MEGITDKDNKVNLDFKRYYFWNNKFIFLNKSLKIRKIKKIKKIQFINNF